LSAPPGPAGVVLFAALPGPALGVAPALELAPVPEAGVL
jgi:hypothetical protein